MALKQIDAGTAFKRVRDGKPIYILQPISKRTTIEDMMDAVAFAEVIQEEPEQEEPKAEEVAEQTEAPADKSRKPKSIVNHDKIVELYQSGWTTKAIAKVVEASDQTVRNHLKAAGIPLRVKI